MSDRPSRPDLPLRRILEGPTELLVPAWPPASPAAARGPGRTRRGLFFNPASAFARDLSVLYLAAVVRPGLRVLDGLTGVGARAARWRREVPGDYQITANDRSPDAVAVAGRNLAPDRERGAGVRLLQRPLGDLLAAERFDLIEIDAPGTPAPFLDAACRAVRAGPPGGHLLVTATDAIALAGAQPDVCHRRYGARPLRGELGHEVAVRILLGAVVRAAARCGLAAAPVLAYRHDHLYGAFVRLVEDDQAASLARDALGYAALCPWCWDRRVVPGGVPPAACAACGRPVRVGGPLWTGGLGDAAVLRRLLALADSRPLAAGDAVRAALAGWLDEAGAPPLFYDLHAAAARCGAVAMPPLETIRQRLESLGHVAVRTHFGRTGVKTDAGPGLILELIAARQRSAVLPGASAPPAPGPRTAPPPRFAGG